MPFLPSVWLSQSGVALALATESPVQSCQDVDDWSCGLDRACPGWHSSHVRVKTVSFEELQRDKRMARLRDERRLARGEVTPEQLQEENSLIPANVRITIPDFCETMERYYGK